MFSILALILLFFNFSSNGLASNLFDLLKDIGAFIVDSMTSTDPTTTNYYPVSKTLPSVYNQNNFTIEYWKVNDEEGIVKIMKTDDRKFCWHSFDWYQFPPFFESNGVLKNIDMWSCELFKVNNYDNLTFFQQNLSKLLYHKYCLNVDLSK